MRKGISLTRIYKGILDLLMVLGATVATMSLVNYITLEIRYLPASLNWLLFVLACYILRFGPTLPKKNHLGKQPLIVFFLLILFWEGLQAALLVRSISFTYFVELVSYYIFFIYFVKASEDYRNIDVIIKPYIAFAIYSCAIIIIAAFAIGSGFLSPSDNPIAESQFRFMNENLSTGTYYFWPGHLSVLIPDARIPLPWPIPVLCGLSHEPHTLCHSIFPALLLLLYYLREKKILFVFDIISIIVVLIFSFSTTALVSLLWVLFFEVILYNSQTKAAIDFLFPLLVVLVVAFLLIQNSDVVSSIFTYSSDKISGSDTTSMRYSSNMILYSLTPTELLGDGIYLNVLSKAPNIGFISALLVNSFFLCFAVLILRNFFSRNTFCHYVGLASLYFFIHSLKMGCLILNYPLLFYIIFLLSYAEKTRKNNKYASAKTI